MKKTSHEGTKAGRNGRPFLLGEILVTPLAMAAYYCALANDGVWQTPHFFQEAFNENGTIEYEFFEKTTQMLPITDSTLKIIQKALYDTVYSWEGTARRVMVNGAEIYAKTGSTENPQGEETHASMAGYVKWDGKAEIAFYVILENAGSGGSVAGPLAAQIISFYQNNIR